MEIFFLLPVALLNHLIRPREKVGRECQSDLFRCLKVYNEFKLRCLLHRQISRLGTFQDLVHVNNPITLPPGRASACVDLLLQSFPLNGSFPYGLASSNRDKSVSERHSVYEINSIQSLASPAVNRGSTTGKPAAPTGTWNPPRPASGTQQRKPRRSPSPYACLP